MRMTWMLCASLAVLLFAAPTTQAAVVKCLYCNDAQMYDKARTLGANTSAHTVWNPANGQVRRYRNYCGSAPRSDGLREPTETLNPPGCVLQTEETSVPVSLAQAGEDLQRIWQATNGSFKIDATVVIAHRDFSPPYVGHANRPSAHDFLYDLSLRGQIFDLAGTQEIFQSAMPELGDPVARLLANTPALDALDQEVSYTITLIFNDGSRIKIETILGKIAKYLPGSARDGSNHILPEPNFQNPAYPGNWHFTAAQAGDFAAFIEYLRQLGISVTGGGSSGTINCTWQPATNTTTCIVPN